MQFTTRISFALFTYLFLYNQKVMAAVDPKLGPPPAGITEIEAVFANFIQVSVGLGFVAMLVMMVMGGIKLLTSGGEPKQINSAQQSITWSVMGMLFMALAWLILQLIAAFTGIEGLKSFNLKI